MEKLCEIFHQVKCADCLCKCSLFDEVQNPKIDKYCKICGNSVDECKCDANKNK